MGAQGSMAMKFGISVLVAFLLGALLKPMLKLDFGHALELSLLLLIASQLFFLLKDLQSVPPLARGLIQLSRSFEGRDGFHDFFILEVLRSFRSDVRTLLEDGIAYRDPAEVAAIWFRINENVCKSMTVTSYVRPEDWWGKPYSDRTICEQIKRKNEGKQIKRVFIWDMQGDLAFYDTPARMLREEGADVRKVQYCKLCDDPMVRPWIGKLKTVDLALIDDSFAFLHFLGKERRTTGALLTRNAEHVNAARRFLELFQNAPPYFEITPTTRAEAAIDERKTNH